MKLYQIINAKESLKKLNEADGLSFKTALTIARDINKIDEVLEVYDNKRKQLIEKYGKKDDNGNLVTENGNAMLKDSNAFANDYNKMVLEDVDLDITKIKGDDLASVKGLTPSDIQNIYFLLEGEKEEKTNG
jgi:hypothetical protein